MRKKLSWDNSLKNKFESEAYAIQSGYIGSLKTVIIESLNAVAPYINNKPRLTSLIKKEIMTRSRLKNKTNKSGKEEDLKAYKKQRNLVLKVNRKAKKKLKIKTFGSFAKTFLQRRVRNTTKILP